MTWEILLISIALAMDCFTVSIACGFIVRKAQWSLLLRLAFFFGLFQALMPLLGWLLTSGFSQWIEAFDHWVAFGMLSFIGVKLIVESFKKEEEKTLDPGTLRSQLALAVATSIDALAVGITFACTGYATLRSLTAPLLSIGIVSFAMSVGGFLLGVRFGSKVREKVHPELIGGIILIGIGVKILLEHLLQI